MDSANVSVQYLGPGFPNGRLMVPHPDPSQPTVMLQHVVDGGPDTPPFRFGFADNFTVAVYTGPNELPPQVLEKVLPPLRHAAILENQGAGPQHYRVTP